MNIKTRVQRIEQATEPSFNEAIEWVEYENPIVAKVIKRKFGKLTNKTDPDELPDKITLEEATKMYLELLK